MMYAVKLLRTQTRIGLIFFQYFNDDFMNSVRSNPCLIRTDLVELGSFGSFRLNKESYGGGLNI